MMKYLIATLLLATISLAQADISTEIGKAIGKSAAKDATRAIAEENRKVSQAAFMTALCESEGSYSDTALCFMTPSGKRVWELEGTERAYWMEVGQEHHKEAMHQKRQEQKRQREKTKQQVDAYKINLQLCQFWRDQPESERKSAKEREYCGV